MSDVSLPIFCGDCGAKGTVKMAQLAAPLQCRCGSTDLGLDGIDNPKTAAATEEYQQGRVHGLDGLPAAKQSTAYLSGHQDGQRELQGRFRAFASGREPWMQQVAIQATAAGGTGWGKAMPSPTQGWSEYAGPTPQVVHRNPDVAQENQGTCPVCHGTGRDPVSDRSACRECGGSGQAPTSPTGGPNPQYGESRDPGRALPAGGAHWAAAEAKYPDHLADGESTTWWGHKITHNTRVPLGDNNQPARGYLASTFTVEHPTPHPRTGATHEFYSSSPYKRNAPTPPQKSYAADQAHEAAQNCLRCGSTFDQGIGGREGAKARPGSPEDVIRHSTPGYGERGMRPAPQQQFDPEDSESFYPKADSISPNVKSWEPAKPTSGPYRMDMASCPNCGTQPTELVKDKDENAWWHCSHCGPLANIDRNPEIDPYHPPENFQPDRSMKTGGFLSRNRKTGRLMSMLAVLHEHNELGEAEAVSLARESLRQYGEDR